MKRFYKDAAAGEVQGGFDVRLDGKPVKTPGRAPLTVPSRALAEAIAGEWLDQGETIEPATMPLTQIAATVIDHLAENRAVVEANLVRFAETDLVCYRAEEPPALVQLQRTHWQPLLEWLVENWGVRLAVTAGVLPVPQGSEAIASLADIVARMDAWRLGAFQVAVAASGSFVIGLALTEGLIGPEEAFAASELDETYEMERWGEDREAIQRRRIVSSDLAASRRFRDLLNEKRSA